MFDCPTKAQFTSIHESKNLQKLDTSTSHHCCLVFHLCIFQKHTELPHPNAVCLEPTPPTLHPEMNCRVDLQWAAALFLQAVEFGDMEDEAGLYSNRSLALLKSNNAESALEAANLCIEARPGWSKGLLSPYPLLLEETAKQLSYMCGWNIRSFTVQTHFQSAKCGIKQIFAI